MIALWISLVWAHPLTEQAVHELEWRRADPLLLAAQLPGAEASDRAEIARALGRLADPGALEVLEPLQEDPDLAVRRAAASALARTPGSAETLRAWLQAEPLPRGWASQRAAAEGVVVRLLDGLGRQGSARDLQLLRARLMEPWPVGAAAARALGRLGMRDQVGLEPAVQDLITRLDGALDPRMIEACAWAVQRTGLPEELGASAVQTLRLTALHGPSSPARSWALKAVWPALSSAEQEDLFLQAITGPDRLTRLAALDALRPGDVPVIVVAAYTADPDPWLRWAAVDAVGRLAPEEELPLLERLAESEDLVLAARAIKAMGRGDPTIAQGAEVPLALRVAHTELLADPEVLVALALSEAPPALHTAAAQQLLGLDAGSPQGRELLGSTDPVVREVGVELVGRGGAKEQLAVLLSQARVEHHGEVLGACLEALLKLAKEEPRLLAPQAKVMEGVIARAAAHEALRPRHAAVALAEALGLPAPELPAERSTRTLLLPSGEEVTVSGGFPVVEEARRILGARVQTSAGPIVLELNPEVAPMAVANFAQLAEEGFYDGLPFHRVIPGFVVQGGCPRGDGWGGPPWQIPDELSSEPFVTGSLGMARAAPNTAGSQWFVTTSPQPHLDGDYTQFGQVVQGLSLVQRMSPMVTVEHIEVERVRADHEGP